MSNEALEKQLTDLYETFSLLMPEEHRHEFHVQLCLLVNNAVKATVVNEIEDKPNEQ